LQEHPSNGVAAALSAFPYHDESFERYVPIQSSVARSIHFPHASCTERSDNRIPADLSTGCQPQAAGLYRRSRGGSGIAADALHADAQVTSRR
jgi:hypothetical protein